MKRKDIILLSAVAILTLPAIKLVMWLIKDYGISPIILTLAIIYVVLVVPQYNALHALSLINAHNQEEDLSKVKPSKLNWIIFINDIQLVQFYGTDTLLKKINSMVIKISLPIMLLSLLYINFLVVFIDLGVTVTLIIMYAMLISIFAYLISKTIIIMYFIYIFKGFVPSLLGILQPFGFMFITGAAKHYFSSVENIRHEDTMGIGYD